MTTNPLNLTELQIALLRSAAVVSLRLDSVVPRDIPAGSLLSAISGLVGQGLITPDSTAVGAGYITTDAGKWVFGGAKGRQPQVWALTLKQCEN